MGFDYTFTWRNFTYVLDVGFETILDTLTVASHFHADQRPHWDVHCLPGCAEGFLGRSVMEFTSMLSFALPGTVIGIGYILAFNQRPLLLTGTLTVLVANFVFRYVPVGIQNGIAALHQIDPSIEEAATNLGANSQTVFRRVTLPLISPAFFSGLVFAFVRAMTAISASDLPGVGGLEPDDGADLEPSWFWPLGCRCCVQFAVGGNHCGGYRAHSPDCGPSVWRPLRKRFLGG